MEEQQKKKVSESAVENHILIVHPPFLNYLQTVWGGALLGETDKLATAVAQMHSGDNCVTLSVDFRFLAPAIIGDVLIFKASVNKAWKTTMEVGIKVFKNDYKTGEITAIASGYLIFAPIDENKRVTRVKYGLIPETDEQKRRYEEAEQRRQSKKR